jgi:A/G-specific adenine glycosylase
MEIGALICSPTSPQCLDCPLGDGCQGYAQGNQEKLPVKKKKARPKTMQMEVGILIQDQQLFFVRREQKGLLSGMWSFPIVEQTDEPSQAIGNLLTQYTQHLPQAHYLGHSRHVFSHVIWEMEVYAFYLSFYIKEDKAIYSSEVADQTCFIPINETDRLTLPVAFKKLLPLLEQHS